MSGNEAEFLNWMEEEGRQREVRRLLGRVRQLEKLQLASYGLIWFWVAVMFCGYRYRPQIITAEIAGLVTIVALFGGGFVLWHIVRLKREAERRVEQLENERQTGRPEHGE